MGIIVGLGAVGLVVALVIILIMLLPSVIAFGKKLKNRVVYLVINLLLVATLFFNVIISVIGWLVMMIIVLTSKKEIKTESAPKYTFDEEGH